MVFEEVVQERSIKYADQRALDGSSMGEEPAGGGVMASWRERLEGWLPAAARARLDEVSDTLQAAAKSVLLTLYSVKKCLTDTI